MFDICNLHNYIINSWLEILYLAKLLCFAINKYLCIFAIYFNFTEFETKIYLLYVKIIKNDLKILYDIYYS